MIGTIERTEGLLDGHYRISLLTQDKPQLEALKDKTVEIIIKEKKHKRSLDANSYYWVLEGKLADALRISKAHLHNILLSRYGQIFTIEGRTAYFEIPETEESQRTMEESTTLHLRPTCELTEIDGVTYRTYQMLRGSHTYDTTEMAILIDGLVSECKEQGIETATPEEIERMLAAYEQEKHRMRV